MQTKRDEKALNDSLQKIADFMKNEIRDLGDVSKWAKSTLEDYMQEFLQSVDFEKCDNCGEWCPVVERDVLRVIHICDSCWDDESQVDVREIGAGAQIRGVR